MSKLDEEYFLAHQQMERYQERRGALVYRRCILAENRGQIMAKLAGTFTLDNLLKPNNFYRRFLYETLSFISR